MHSGTGKFLLTAKMNVGLTLPSDVIQGVAHMHVQPSLSYPLAVLFSTQCMPDMHV